MTDVSALAQVPLTDLTLPRELERQILIDIADVARRGAFINGPEVAAFEEAFARYCGSDHCVGVASGLDALRLALVAGGLGAGQEVILPAHTFVATLEAVVQAGGRPVLVDINDSDFTLDPDAVADAVTQRTRFVIPVHLYGQLADMASLEPLARRHDLVLVEDAAQAHGATRGGFRAGTSGAAAAFSFYPTKNLGAFGDAGALVTHDAEIAARTRALREHGQRRKHHHEYVGYTARLDTIQAAVLLRKLPYLHDWNEQRRAAARTYSGELADIGDLRLPKVAEDSEHVWYVYVVRTRERDELAEFLSGRGIATGIHYPHPVHKTPAYAAHAGGRRAFPVAEAVADEVLSLPLFPGITREQQASVVSAIHDFFRRG